MLLSVLNKIFSRLPAFTVSCKWCCSPQCRCTHRHSFLCDDGYISSPF